MAVKKEWWVACSQWADGTPYTEEGAKATALKLDADETPCDGEHYYWRASTPPTWSGINNCINIPEGARRA